VVYNNYCILDSAVGNCRCEQSLIELKVSNEHWTTLGKGIEAIWPLASTIWIYSGKKKTVHHIRAIVKLLYLEIQIYDLYLYMFLFSLKSVALWHGAYITPHTHTHSLHDTDALYMYESTAWVYSWEKCRTILMTAF